MRALPIWAARQKAKKGNGGGLDHPQRRRTAGPQRQHRRPCCRARSRCEEGRGRAKSRNRAALDPGRRRDRRGRCAGNRSFRGRRLLSDQWSVAGRSFHSRLIVGTGKYRAFEKNEEGVEASGADREGGVGGKGGAGGGGP